MPSNSNNTNETVPSTQPVGSRFRDAYEQALPEMEAVADVDLVHINVDLVDAVTAALGAWPNIKATRAELEAGLPNFDLAMFDKLERYALATGHAHTLYGIAKGPVTSLVELGDRVVQVREALWTDASGLAKHGLLDADRVKHLRAGKAYGDIAFDVFRLVALMRESWSTIAGKIVTDTAALDAAEQLADELVSEVGQRDHGPGVIAAAALNRQRAFTLFLRAYDQVRRAISYLRWSEGDGDEIAPSLYAGRGNGNHRRRGEGETDLPVVAAAATVSSAASAPAPSVVLPQGSAVGQRGSVPLTR